MSIPNFGSNYAVLNLDLMSALIEVVRGTEAGDAFISNTKKWVDAVHRLPSPPLTIFTTLYFANDTAPELKPGAPFTNLVKGFGVLEKTSPGAQIDSAFEISERDIVLQKTRWYAGSGNTLEQILRSQNIDTVVISGLATSGAILSTAYRLFDLDYRIFVISDNVLELTLADNNTVNDVAINKIIPKMFGGTVTVDEAIQALGSPIKGQEAVI